MYDDSDAFYAGLDDFILCELFHQFANGYAAALLAARRNARGRGDADAERACLDEGIELKRAMRRIGDRDRAAQIGAIRRWRVRTEELRVAT